MADVELNSIGNGDGTNYLVRDNSKIPLSGTNALAGSIVPATDNTVNLGSISYNFKYINTKFLSSNSDLNLFSSFNGNTAGSFLTLKKIDSTSSSGSFQLNAHSETQIAQLIGYPNGTLTWAGKNVAMQEDTIPRSGGAVLSSNEFYRTVNDSTLAFRGGSRYDRGGGLILYGKDQTIAGGAVELLPRTSMTVQKDMLLYPSGTWTWDGTACQITSDQRYKQQIAEIDDKLLDAWEDVNLVQFKYNDAVKEKSDNARLHTGFVVQQIDSACKSHGVDISEYGLYCHEVYQEETREVEVEQADGTKVKERKVIREASEHYSLRYTEALIVECAFLRKKNKDLQEQLNALSERLEKLENR